MTRPSLATARRSAFVLTHRLLLATALWSVCPTSGPATADDGPVLTLEAPGSVWGLRITKNDEGGRDLWIVAGRDVHQWRGVKGKPFPKVATAVFHVPDGATYVAPGREVGTATERTQTLLALGRTEALRIVAGRGVAVEEGLEVDMPWSDPQRAVLGDFVDGKSLFLPTSAGLRFVPDWIGAPSRSVLLPLRPTRNVTASGPFVEDGATVRVSWPKPMVVSSWPKVGDPAAVFWIGGDGIHAYAPGKEGAYVDRVWSTAFVPKDGERRDSLVDFDADGTPDWAHAATTNESGSYAFFKTPTEGADHPSPTAERPSPRGSVRLTGFQLPAEFPDLDGDGRKDLVVTTIDIDGTNVMRAVLQHRVTAKTHAFLNRSAKGAEFFAPAFDAIQESDIGVQILFTFSGSIEVKRSFTILTTADLDGDGRKDLVIRTGPETLSVYRGTAEGVWATKATTIAIPAMGRSPDIEGYASDLDGDGRDDVVLLYRAPPGGADRTVVVMSR